MDFLAPFHPRVVHFPIALALTGVTFLLMGIYLKREHWAGYGRLSLLLAWVGMILAALTGLIDQSAAPDTPVVTTTLNQHITVGILLIIVFGIALYWPLRNRQLWADPYRRLGYIALLLLGVALLLVEGWLGGVLVYTLGVGVE